MSCTGMQRSRKKGAHDQVRQGSVASILEKNVIEGQLSDDVEEVDSSQG